MENWMPVGQDYSQRNDFDKKMKPGGKLNPFQSDILKKSLNRMSVNI
jgi:hypothetical protein